MMKKYELLDNDTKTQNGVTLRRVRALRSFGSIEEGELGGFIEKEENLSHEGDAWVYGDAWVSGNARVSGDARVYGNAWVSGNADWLLVGPFNMLSLHVCNVLQQKESTMCCKNTTSM